MDIKTIFLQTTSSTQDFAKEHALSFDPQAITCIYAEEQTKGRGRFNRVWVSPKEKNIYLTFYFQLDKNTQYLTTLSHLLAITLLQTLKELGFDPLIKWPNDIYLNEKKVSGILCEMDFLDNHVDIFLGVGINVNSTQEDLKNIDQETTSLYLEKKTLFDRNHLLLSLQKHFIKNLELFKNEGFIPFHSYYESYLLYKGQKVVWTQNNLSQEGVLLSTNIDGSLNLIISNQKVTITSGSIRKK